MSPLSPARAPHGHSSPEIPAATGVCSSTCKKTLKPKANATWDPEECPEVGLCPKSLGEFVLPLPHGSAQGRAGSLLLQHLPGGAEELLGMEWGGMMVPHLPLAQRQRWCPHPSALMQPPGDRRCPEGLPRKKNIKKSAKPPNLGGRAYQGVLERRGERRETCWVYSKQKL